MLRGNVYVVLCIFGVHAVCDVSQITFYFRSLLHFHFVLCVVGVIKRKKVSFPPDVS